VRFSTNATTVMVRLRFTNLVTRADTYNGAGLVLVDGAVAQRFTREPGPSGDLAIFLSFGAATTSVIEVLMPYCASVDILGLELTPGATLAVPGARRAASQPQRGFR
jgi:hypothetical protein